jgi:hypothetical protein
MQLREEEKEKREKVLIRKGIRERRKDRNKREEVGK